MATSRRELSDAYEAQDLIIQAAQDAKRLATQDYRAHLDKIGMDKDGIKAEVEGFKKAYRRKMDGKKKGTEVVEHVDAIADEIYLEITTPAPRATRVANTVPEGFDPETGEEITEPQPAPQAASDLTSPKPSGQVAPIQPETANDFGPEAGDATPEAPEANEQGGNPVGADAGQPGVTGGESAATHRVMSMTPLEPREAGGLKGFGFTVSFEDKPRYADPGVVVMETCPPEGIIAHPYAVAWPMREITLADGEEVREPIVKVGKFIVDGRQRYFAARAKGIEYPVVQYAGDDLLADVIRFNVASRTMSEAALRIVAQKLAKLEPHREADILQLMGLSAEVEAA